MSQAPEVDQGSTHSSLPSAPNEMNLVWIDMEMTGLNPDLDRVIELAAIVTDAELNVLAEGPVFTIHQTDQILDGMDAWNKGTHGRSGLIDRVKASTTTEEQASAQMIDFLRAYVPAGKSPMCGNSICQDRRFMARYMPELVNWFHYRNLDVSTVKELCKRWRPDLSAKVNKTGAHTALADIHESIDELRFYRTHFIKAE